METELIDTVPAAVVLRDHPPRDVAREMICQGCQKDPFYIFDMDEMYERVQHFKDMMPRIKIFYAMKSNDTSMVLKLAIALGVGFDCASPGEIYKLRKLNVSPQSIIYAMPTKTEDQMMYARNSGVQHTTFDTSYELKKIKEYWPDARLLLRIRVDSVSLIPLGEKFGCDYETEAVELLDEAASLGLKVVGIAFHVGCICSSLESYATGLRHARALFDHEAQAGRKMSVMDIGGGFASDRIESIDQVSKIINASIEELFPDPDILIMAEPGRYICDSAFTLYSSISNVRRVRNHPAVYHDILTNKHDLVKRNDKLVNMIYMNDGVYGTIRFSETSHKISKFQANGKIDTSESEDTILWGPSCDSIDEVMKDFDVRLPRCTPLDWLVFENLGAYTICFSTCFSSLPIPLIRPVISMNLWKRIKCCKIFTENDFLVDPVKLDPLSSTLPRLLPFKEDDFELNIIQT